jgi:DNA-binding LacI/PurR family transcriptional regulator
VKALSESAFIWNWDGLMALGEAVGATIHDVARAAGVSISTVSRVINGTVPVAEETAARVQAAMRALRYVPRAAARSLATRRTQTLGLLLANMAGDFFEPLLSGIEAVATEAGYALLISLAGRRGPHAALPPGLGPHNSDGLLVFVGSLTAAGIAHGHALGLPMVLIQQSAPEGLPIPCVTIENQASARAIVEHLIVVHGRRRIALLQGPAGNEDGERRAAGYREAVAAHGLALDPRLALWGNFERGAARAAVSQLIRSGTPFDAVFTGDDEAAVGALQALRAHGRRVPEAVSVVGFDDQRLAEVVSPPLTTVRAPTEAVGAEAARQLLRLVQGEAAAPRVVLPTAVVVRRSCGCDG